MKKCNGCGGNHDHEIEAIGAELNAKIPGITDVLDQMTRTAKDAGPMDDSDTLRLAQLWGELPDGEFKTLVARQQMHLVVAMEKLEGLAAVTAAAILGKVAGSKQPPWMGKPEKPETWN